MKKLKIFLLISLLVCFGFALSSEVHAEDDGPKVFAVNDVLPVTTQLRISWVSDVTNLPTYMNILTNGGNSTLLATDYQGSIYINNIKIFDKGTNTFEVPYTNYDGDHAYYDIDTSNWSLGQRTIYSINSGIDGIFTWEDLASESPSEPDPSGPKPFGEGDILPPKYIRIRWNWSGITFIIFQIKTESDSFVLIDFFLDGEPSDYIKINNILIFDQSTGGWQSPYTDSDGDHAYIDIDTSNWSLEKRTISSVEVSSIFTWEDLGSVYYEGYSDGYESAREYYGLYENGIWFTADQVINIGYESAREIYGYYDSSTDEWLTVLEYIDRYGSDKMDQTDFYNNFDKYFIPAMIIVFGGAIVLTLLKVFKGRE